MTPEQMIAAIRARQQEIYDSVLDGAAAGAAMGSLEWVITLLTRATPPPPPDVTQARLPLADDAPVQMGLPADAAAWMAGMPGRVRLWEDRP